MIVFRYFSYISKIGKKGMAVEVAKLPWGEQMGRVFG
jgi:hypothetical protein